MPKIQSNIKKIVFEDEMIVDSIDRVITAVQLLEARGRILTRERAKYEKLKEENAELKRKNNELKELIKQHYSYIKDFPKSQLEETK
ncbi:uncharacterized protein METZ01_LOCUS343742 [marine metagenome]|uniref:Uncharacterized protein n=1 Tax=marine metagenome TaxID=408172 RepID=A0A382R1D2_9ZZZZ